MTLYVESSAVLAWLFGETTASEVAPAMSAAERIVTSELTLVECERAILRVRALGRLEPEVAGDLQGRLAEASATWSVEGVTTGVLARARAPFPDDAIRTLDAVHLATALVIEGAGGDLDILSLDDRIRANARALGFRVLPA